MCWHDVGECTFRSKYKFILLLLLLLPSNAGTVMSNLEVDVLDELGSRINNQWEVIALEQLTSHIEQAHNNSDPSRLR